MPSIYRGNAIHNSIPSMVEYELDYSMTVTLIAEVDLSEVEKLRDKLGAEKPSYSALVIKALALALRDFPYANQRIVRGRFFPLLRSRIQKIRLLGYCDGDRTRFARRNHGSLHASKSIWRILTS
jgi:hypothetical protein